MNVSVDENALKNFDDFDRNIERYRDEVTVEHYCGEEVVDCSHWSSLWIKQDHCTVWSRVPSLCSSVFEFIFSCFDSEDD